MARKLTKDEQHLFTEAIQSSDAALSENISDPFLKLLQEKRDAALAMSPELSEWLDSNLPHPT